MAVVRPKPDPPGETASYHRRVPDVALFPTCVIETLAPNVGASVVRVLRNAGYDVHIPDDVTCCGQPAWNAGFATEAAKVARTSMEALAADDAETIVVPAGSCAAMIRVYWPELFRVTGDEDASLTATSVGEKVMELTEFLAEHSGAGPAESPDDAEVAYHHSCHMLRELHIESAPEAVISEAGYALSDWPMGRQCCGFGGTFSLKLPEVSVAMADEKIDAIPESATCLAGSDLSCLIHLEARLAHRGIDLPVVHTAELLDQ